MLFDGRFLLDHEVNLRPNRSQRFEREEWTAVAKRRKFKRKKGSNSSANRDDSSPQASPLMHLWLFGG